MTVARVDRTTPWTLPVAAAVAVAAFAVAAAALWSSDEPGARTGDALGYGLLAVASLALVIMAWRPAEGMLAAAGVSLVSMVLGYPGGALTVVLLAALYGVAASGHRRAALGLVALFAGAGSIFRLAVESDPPVAVALNASLFVLVALLGDGVAGRRALRLETQQRLHVLAREQEREGERRVVEERLRIARELHDVMAHTITSMSVQAGVAADVVDDDPGQAKVALHTVRSAARDAMSELRATVAVLRDGDSGTPQPPAPGLEQLDALVASVRRQGLHIDVTTDSCSDRLPPAVELTAYRIVQETLTNVLRHADASKATVTLECEPDTLAVTVADDGRGPVASQSEGHGIHGMRERVEALGGTLRIGRAEPGGFVVRAQLPMSSGAT